jgi:RND family efflux transporter MFP subunit
VAARAVQEAKAEMDAAQATVDELHSRAASLALERTAMAARRDALAKQLELLIDERQAKDSAVAEAQAAAARVAQTGVALEQAKLQLARMTVRAPVDGRVYQLVSTPGTTLAGNMPKSEFVDSSTVITMYRPEMLQVRVDVRFEDLPKISRGQAARIENPALAAPIAGEVLFVGSEADIQKNTLPVKVALTAPAPMLKPEMLVDVQFLAPQSRGSLPPAGEALRLFVPRALVERDGAGEFVWVADQSSRVARRTAVSTAPAASGELVEVTRGLTLASRLIAEGRAGLRDGQRIEIAGEASLLANAHSDAPQVRENHTTEEGAR